MRSNESTNKKEKEIEEVITTTKKDEKKKNDSDDKKDKEKVPTDHTFILDHSINKFGCQCSESLHMHALPYDLQIDAV